MSGRYHDVVYVFDTQNGRLIDTIPVGQGPHGLALTPLPARYSDRLADTSRADQDHVLRASARSSDVVVGTPQRVHPLGCYRPALGVVQYLDSRPTAGG